MKRDIARNALSGTAAKLALVAIAVLGLAFALTANGAPAAEAEDAADSAPVGATYTPALNITKTLVNQDGSAHNFPEGKSFHYSMMPVPSEDPGGVAPMPKDSQVTTVSVDGVDYSTKRYKLTWTATAADAATNTATFPLAKAGDEGAVMTFTQPGDYRYLVTEIPPTNGTSVPGVTDDTTVYRITLTATQDASGALSVAPTKVESAPNGIAGTEYKTVWDAATAGSSVSDIKLAFTNTYSPTSASETIRLYKELNGRPFGADEFSFYFEANGVHQVSDREQKLLADGTVDPAKIGQTFGGMETVEWDLSTKIQPMPTPAGSTDYKTTANTRSLVIKNSADGIVEFAPLHFDADALGFNSNPDIAANGLLFKYNVLEWYDSSALSKGVKSDNTNHFILFYVHQDKAADGQGSVLHVTRFDGVLNPTNPNITTYVEDSQIIQNVYASSATMDLKGTLGITGRDFAAGDQFSFAVKAQKVTSGIAAVAKERLAPIPLDDNGQPVSMVEADPSSGTSADLDFGTLSFDQKDIGNTYRYSVVQNAPEEANITYDSAPYAVDVTVGVGEDGALKLSTALSLGTAGSVTPPATGSDNTVATLNWTDTYSEKQPSQPTDPSNPDGPDTPEPKAFVEFDPNGGTGSLMVTNKVVDPSATGSSATDEKTEGNGNANSTSSANGTTPGIAAGGASTAGGDSSATDAAGKDATADKDSAADGSNPKFSFHIQLSDPEGKPLEGTLDYSLDGGKTVAGQVKDGVLDIDLADGESVLIGAIPAGTTYKVTESSAQGYKTSVTGATGSIAENVRSEAVFTNTKEAAASSSGASSHSGSSYRSGSSFPKTGDELPAAALALAGAMALTAVTAGFAAKKKNNR